MATAFPRRPPFCTALTVSSASALRLRYPTATPHPARASSSAVARPMPRPPPVTKARFPEKSITTHPHCGLGIADCGLEDRPSNPQSAIRNPQSCAHLCLHDPANHMFDRQLQLLDMRGLIGRN